jgi:hypothetical protein
VPLASNTGNENTSVLFFRFERVSWFMVLYDSSVIIDQSAISAFVHFGDAANRTVSALRPQVKKITMHAVNPVTSPLINNFDPIKGC